MKNLFLFFFIFLTACASIVSDSDYPVVINSSPPEASFTIKNRDGSIVHAGKTPYTVTLPAGSSYFRGERYVLEFKSDGYSDQMWILNSKLDGWYIGNLLLGGILGLLVVDPITGAMFELPKRVDVHLQPNSSAMSETTLKITTIDQLSEEQKKQLKPLTP